MNNEKRAILMTMKPLSIKICLLLGMLVSATSIFSRPTLHDLNIKVLLSKKVLYRLGQYGREPDQGPDR